MMKQSQIKFLHRPKRKTLRGNSLRPIPLQIFMFQNTLTISKSGEFEGDFKIGIGNIKIA